MLSCQDTLADAVVTVFTQTVPSPLYRWVDDCHAAVVCRDPSGARQLLAAAAGGEFQLRGYVDAGSGTRALPASGAAGSVSAELMPGLAVRGRRGWAEFEPAGRE
jgi:hypothetical protein